MCQPPSPRIEETLLLALSARRRCGPLPSGDGNQAASTSAVTKPRTRERQMFIGVTVDEASLRFSRNVTGIVFFEFGTFQFPQRDWNDFVVVILGWWLDATTKLMAAGEGETELYFMDGPYALRIVIVGGLFKISRGRDDVATETTAFNLEVESLTFLHAILNASKMVLSACASRGWATADTEALQHKVSRLDTRH